MAELVQARKRGSVVLKIVSNSPGVPISERLVLGVDLRSQLGGHGPDL